MTGTRPGLGRLVAEDPRDRGYLLRRCIRPQLVRQTKYWALFYGPMDQGQTGTCVGHGWKAWMLTAPTIQTKPASEPTAFTLYREATRIDEWPDNDDDLQSGTSVRAGAQALQKRGILQTYGWAWDVETVADWLCASGPLVLGTAWPESFFDPEASGHVRWTPGSPIAGGHCFAALGWDQKRGRVRCINSWGPDFGQNGRFWIDGETLEKLFSADGEACSALEVRL